MRQRTYRPLLFPRSYDVAVATTVRASLYNSTGSNPVRIRPLANTAAIQLEKEYGDIIINITTGASPAVDMRYPVTTKRSAAYSGDVTPVTLTADQMRGHIWTNIDATGDLVVNLPPGETGMHGWFVRLANHNYTIQKDPGDTFYERTSTPGVGFSLDSVSAYAEAVCVAPTIWILIITGARTLLS